MRDLSEIPLDMVAKLIPASTCAVFTHRGPLGKLPDTFRHGYRAWLPVSPYEPAAPFYPELYDSRFTPDSSDSEVDVCIPVRGR